MALYNEGLEHEMVDGALFQDEVNARNISSVPAVYAGDTLVHIGKASLGDLLAALEEKIGAEPVSAELSAVATTSSSSVAVHRVSLRLSTPPVRVSTSPSSLSASVGR